MPTYQYRCTACGEELEAFQKFTDASLTTCPSCEGSLRKVFSAVGVVFKGSGFYSTDSRKASSSSSSANGSKSESVAAKSESGGSTSASASSSSSSSEKSTPSKKAGATA